MTIERIFDSAHYFRLSDDDPIRSVVTESAEAVVVAWCVLPGQRIAAHLHPHGQDTWSILSGQGEYLLESDGSSRPVRAGHVVVAPKGCVHGVLNTGDEALRFISVVSPGEAGYVLA
jgi:quercetin dioxygenase-like cupin family protein